jgi:hypothetical protein
MGLKFGTLWFGNEPTLLQYLSWSSYIYHGHELNIYLYDMSIEVPDGAIKKDANEIVLEKDIFLTKFDNELFGGGHAQFADFFRLHMLKNTNLIWTDSDSVCLKDEWPDPEPYLFGFLIDTPHPAKEPVRIGNGILYINDEKILNELINNFVFVENGSRKDQIANGPELLTKIIEKNNLMMFVKEESVFNPIRYSHIDSFIDPIGFEYSKKLIRNSVAVSLFSSSWKRHQVEIPSMSSTPQENTLIGYLTKKYMAKQLNLTEKKGETNGIQ